MKSLRVGVVLRLDIDDLVAEVKLDHGHVSQVAYDLPLLRNISVWQEGSLYQRIDVNSIKADSKVKGLVVAWRTKHLVRLNDTILTTKPVVVDVSLIGVVRVRGRDRVNNYEDVISELCKVYEHIRVDGAAEK